MPHRIDERIKQALRLIRFENWWQSKMPPLLAVAYLEILRRDIPLSLALLLVGCYLFSVCSVAAYGHVVNDLFDIEVDRRAAKPNAMVGLGRGTQALLPAAFLAAGFLPALLADYSPWTMVLLGLNYLWPTIYSLPIIRLKERGLAGVLCDAAGSHVTPTLMALVLFGAASPGPAPGALFFPAILTLWACALGVKGILHHQVIDRDCDARAGVATFATGAAPGQIERFLPRYNLLVEGPISAALAIAVFAWCPLATATLALHIILETLKFGLGFRFALNGEPRTNRPSIPFVNEFFYTVWLPLAAAAELALADPRWFFLLAAHVGMFGPLLQTQFRDVRAILSVLSCQWQR